MATQEKNREESITYSFIQTDRIWPPFIAATHDHPFIMALVEVLKRLPDDAYDEIEDSVSFVVEDFQVIAINVPFEKFYPSVPNGLKVRFDTIVLFHLLNSTSAARASIGIAIFSGTSLFIATP